MASKMICVFFEYSLSLASKMMHFVKYSLPQASKIICAF